ncbi:neocarzinostatin apoprotein domain-containing protein [Corynebacterium amycolatum]|uniref:neocarzinostatin apoprotein domain-containing protein n=1 Tax=Corynebacterium amycolatum TaxID=43765 RepID=UPI003B5BA2E9
MTTRTFQRRAAFLAIPAVAALPLLAACGSDDADGAAQDAANASETTSSAETQETAGTAGEETMEAEPVNDLSEGDVISVDLSGLDPDYGYYAALCAAEKAPGNPVPDCTGDRSAGTQSQQWITKKSGGTTTIADDNTAHFELSVVPTGEAVDCTQQDCVLKLFGDHSEGFEDITEIPVTFAK